VLSLGLSTAILVAALAAAIQTVGGLLMRFATFVILRRLRPPSTGAFDPKASLSAQGSGLSTHCYAATAARSENIPLAVAAFHLSLLPGSDHGSASGTSLRNTGRSVVGGEAGI
jgi:hypothetical protein